MNVYALGASRNIGYFSSVRLLAKEQGLHSSFGLRPPSSQMKSFAHNIRSGHAHLVKGDAMISEDVAKGWAVAQDNGSRPVDLVLFTVGGVPSFKLTKGLVFEPKNLVTQSLLNVLSTYPASPSPPPKFITLSSIGLTPASHANLPLLMKPLYGSLLSGPHDDKLGSERVAMQAIGQDWPSSYPQIKQGIMPEGWRESLSQNGVTWKGVIIRPALLTDGACKGDTAPAGKLPYRPSEEDHGDGYRISRKDVAHFIVEVLLKDWEKWEGKALNLAY